MNRLSQEKSPYLLQHQYNPVNWYPWGEEAFVRARADDKPIFLSIGYSTCYWCHVMEKDSFETEEIAEILNADYISIKVDREERPDVDAIYMDAVVGLTGHGGWPMSVFLTPELKPFFGGTFFPRAQFAHLLRQITDAWKNRREAILLGAGELTLHLAHTAEEVLPIDGAILIEALMALKNSFDPEWGGFGSAPKFPPSMTLQLLLRIFLATRDHEALSIVQRTLDRMARGGIYDHLGGGFHRYATDERWLIPHFEKMLYDNALLTLTYAEAYQLTQNRMYAVVLRDSLNYILRELTDLEGGFYSAQDAGEVNREGEFYVWSEAELRSILNEEEMHLLRRTYGVTEQGNFEGGKNVLHLEGDWHLREDPILEPALHKLLLARSQRPHPHRDEKILTAWNGLAIGAFAAGYRVLGEERFLRAALRSAEFLRTHLWRDGVLLRRYFRGNSGIAAVAEDYTYLIFGLLRLYEVSFDGQWYSWAQELQHLLDETLWDTESGGYFASPDASLVVRKKELIDGATPSPNGLAAQNLLRFFHLTGESRYRERAERIFAVVSKPLSKYPTAFASLLMAFELHEKPVQEVTVLAPRNGQERSKFLDALRGHLLPHVVLAAAESGATTPPLLRGKEMVGGRETFYICENQTCSAPVHSADEVMRRLLRWRNG